MAKKETNSEVPGGLAKDQWDDDSVYSIVILGASGDLAKKKIYPVLWWVGTKNPSVWIILFTWVLIIDRRKNALFLELLYYMHFPNPGRYFVMICCRKIPYLSAMLVPNSPSTISENPSKETVRYVKRIVTDWLVNSLLHHAAEIDFFSCSQNDFNQVEKWERAIGPFHPCFTTGTPLPSVFHVIFWMLNQLNEYQHLDWILICSSEWIWQLEQRSAYLCFQILDET